MRRFLKWGLISITAIFFLGFLYVWTTFLSRPPQIERLDQVKDMEWHTVRLGGETACSDGSPYMIFVKKGSSDHLAIHFSGGGACWDDYSCASPITLSDVMNLGPGSDLEDFYFAGIPRLFPRLLSGLMNSTDENNAFRGWNMIFLPYCTGDLHLGNIERDYEYEGENFKIHHRGRANVLAATEWIRSNFPSPEKLLVSGESAGAYGSAVWAPYISRLYNGRSLYQLSDGCLLKSDRWEEIVNTIWRADTREFHGFTISDDIYLDAILNRIDTTPLPLVYLQANTTFDFVMPKFDAALNRLSTADQDYILNWNNHLRTSMDSLAGSGLNYQYFLTDCGYDRELLTSVHTMTTSPQFSECESDGMIFQQWLQQNIIEEIPVSSGREWISEEVY